MYDKNFRIQEKPWPENYYSCTDPLKRRELLEQEICAHHREEDTARREVFEKRYEFHKNGFSDRFILSWLELIKTDKTHAGSEKYTALCRNLCVSSEEPADALAEEWQAFASVWIDSCLSSRSYSTGVWGLMPLGEKKTAMRIAGDIDYVTRILAAHAGTEKEFRPLRSILLSTYVRKVNNGEQYWVEATGTYE